MISLYEIVNRLNRRSYRRRIHDYLWKQLLVIFGPDTGVPFSQIEAHFQHKRSVPEAAFLLISEWYEQLVAEGNYNDIYRLSTKSPASIVEKAKSLQRDGLIGEDVVRRVLGAVQRLQKRYPQFRLASPSPPIEEIWWTVGYGTYDEVSAKADLLPRFGTFEKALAYVQEKTCGRYLHWGLGTSDSFVLSDPPNPAVAGVHGVGGFFATSAYTRHDFQTGAPNDRKGYHFQHHSRYREPPM
jgi:hypothetical protein